MTQNRFPAKLAVCIDKPWLAMRILDYLRRNPRAQDTAEGIAEWWVDEHPADVYRALQQLEALRLVRRRSTEWRDLYSAVPQDNHSKGLPESMADMHAESHCPNGDVGFRPGEND